MRWTVIALSLAVLIGYLPVALLVADPPPLMGDEAYYARVPIEMRQRRNPPVRRFPVPVPSA
jgi:hypothetical protein